jgi:glutamine amidotransferase
VTVKSIGIVDYGLGNLFSVRNTCETVGARVEFVTRPEELGRYHGLILPGVGAFGDAAARLQSNGMWDGLEERIRSGVPFLGICLGMQLLFEKSEEFGRHEGLGVFQGTVTHFRSLYPGLPKVPEVGWNTVEALDRDHWEDKRLATALHDRYFYFVHSFVVRVPSPVPAGICAAATRYEDVTFLSAVAKDNVLAVQFHPERSGPDGLALLSSWVDGATCPRGGVRPAHENLTVSPR